MVRVVEQEAQPGTARALGAETRDERGLVPLVYDGDVGAMERLVEIERVGVVDAHGGGELGVRGAPAVERGGAVVAREVLGAPPP